MLQNKKVAVVIPCYKVEKSILSVLHAIPGYVDFIIIVDDACPQSSGKLVLDNLKNEKVYILTHQKNLGVGGAVVTGFKKSLELRADVVVKIDGDGQMDPTIMDFFINPIINGDTDYSKGNRFFWPAGLKSMPTVRKLGNTGLSFLNKLSSGYWDIMDPTNGYFAINTFVLKLLDLDKLAKRYFFESDMLFRLGIVRATVMDIPMTAIYGDEESSLRITSNLFVFIKNHFKCCYKRLVYTYFIRDFNQGSLSFIFAIPLLSFSIIFGSIHWLKAIQTGVVTPLGTLFVAVLPFIVGFQLLLSFFYYDVSSVPRILISRFGKLNGKN